MSGGPLGRYPNHEAEQREFRDPSLASEKERERLSQHSPPAHLEPAEKPKDEPSSESTHDEDTE